MPVVTSTSSLFRTDAGPALDPLLARGFARRATGKVLNAADDASGSKYKLIELPSHVILAEATIFDVENWGFADIRIGRFDTAGAGALVSATKISAVTQSPVTARLAADGKRVWERLGLAADPGGVVGIWAHAIAAATGAGEMPFVVEWIDNL